MPSADQVPTNNSHSRMLWHMWVVLIAGSTGSALRAVRPPNLHITPGVRRDLVYRASAMGSLYLSPLTIIAQTIRAILLASAIAATLVGRRASKAVSQADVWCHGSWRNGSQQARRPRTGRADSGHLVCLYCRACSCQIGRAHRLN